MLAPLPTKGRDTAGRTQPGVLTLVPMVTLAAPASAPFPGMCQSGMAPSRISRVDRLLPVLFLLVVAMAILDVPQFMEV